MDPQSAENLKQNREGRGRKKSETTFSVGTTVGETGTYVCVPCGYKKHLKKGNKFPTCISCMKAKKDSGNDEEFFKGLEQWEWLDNSSN